MSETRLLPNRLPDDLPDSLPDSLPDNLEDIPAGPELSELLAPVDRAALSPRDRIRLARARNRLASHVQTELLADLCAVSSDQPTGDQAER